MGFQQGLSGLNAAAKNLEVIGNNVSNANTVGFKGSQAQFADVYANSLAGSGGAQVGIGVRVAAIAQQFTQGNITTTNNSLDMAVSGNGFFRMNNNGSVIYSRNGQFQLNKDGFVVNSAGQRLTGFLPNALGQIVATTPADLQISTADLLPKQTVSIAAGLNLDSRSAIIPAAPAFDPNNAATFNNSTSMTVYDSLGASHIASLYFAKTSANTWNTHLVVDGNMIPASGAAMTPMTFNTNGTLATPVAAITSQFFNPTPAAISLSGSTINGANTAVVTTTTGISLNATVTGGNFPAGTTVTGINATTNTITLSQATTTPPTAGFAPTGDTTTGSGAISNTSTTGLAVGASVTGAGIPVGATITAINSATSFTISPAATATAVGVALTVTNPGNLSATLTVTNPASAASQTLSFNFAGTSQFGGIFGVNSLSQDGYTSGRMTGFSTGQDGMISGRYSNGQTKTLGQVVLSNFNNPQGLQPLGGNNWAETSTSGTPLTGVPGSASLGVLQTSAVEDANVDLTAELVNMITAQRVYQANAQTVKTMDQVLQTLVNLR